MDHSHLTLPPPEELREAQDQFMEFHGSVAVMNTYLKVALLCSMAINLGLLRFTYRMYQGSRDIKPLVIRISEVGRAEAVTYPGLAYQPQEPEIKYFLTQFVHDYYGRIRATTQETFARSLYFLDNRLTEEIMAKNKQTKALETFLSGQGEELDVQVKNVSIEDLRKAPYHATVDYEKVYYAPSTLQEVRRERYVGNFVFTVKEHVTNALIPVNPLGLEISYFREDQAF
jgi:type IV secretory pathway TrbF-like protein